MLQRLWPDNWSLYNKMELTPKKLIIFAAMAGLEIVLLGILFTVISHYHTFFKNDYLRSIVATLAIDFLLVLNTFILYGFHASFHDLFKSRHFFQDLWIGLVWGFVIFLVMTFCGLLLLIIYSQLGLEIMPQQITQAIVGLQGSYQVLLTILMIIAAPLGEEFFFRGVLHRTLVKYLPVFPALCFSGLGFALFHGDWFQLPQLWIGGILLAISYHKTNSLTTSIVAHAVINTIPLCLSLTL